jgi:hypothetical protein
MAEWLGRTYLSLPLSLRRGRVGAQTVNGIIETSEVGVTVPKSTCLICASRYTDHPHQQSVSSPIPLNINKKVVLTSICLGDKENNNALLSGQVRNLNVLSLFVLQNQRREAVANFNVRRSSLRSSTLCRFFLGLRLSIFSISSSFGLQQCSTV